MVDPRFGEMLERQIQTLETNLNRRLDRQDRELGEIKAQTIATNGRVTDLEKARERIQGVVAAYRWVPVVLSALLTAGMTILVMVVTGAIT